MSILYRTADLSATTGRQIYGIAVPFGQTITVHEAGREYREEFAYGAFTRSIRERGHKVKLLTQHDQRRLAVGKAVELREQADREAISFPSQETSVTSMMLSITTTALGRIPPAML